MGHRNVKAGEPRQRVLEIEEEMAEVTWGMKKIVVMAVRPSFIQDYPATCTERCFLCQHFWINAVSSI